MSPSFAMPRQAKDWEVPASIKPRTNGVKTALQASSSWDAWSMVSLVIISWYHDRPTGRVLLGAFLGDRQQFIGALPVSVGFPNSTKGMIDKLFFADATASASSIGLLSLFDVT
ncbi:unnamed protein product [Tilletia controversa]|nr:unnamed protein product [Tilletia controversa]